MTNVTIVNDQEPIELVITLDPTKIMLTARQLRLGLLAAGVSLDAVDAAIDAIENPTDRAVARVEWEYASQYSRSHNLISQIVDILGMTSEQIDAAWITASSL